MYADDTTLTTTLTPVDDGVVSAATINQALDEVSKWLKVNKLSLNIKKTKFIIFHHPNKQFDPPLLKIDQVPIERVTNFNFLGLTIDQHLTWKDHIDKIAIKIARSSGVLNRLKIIYQ